jgi:hypothetical protein
VNRLQKITLNDKTGDLSLAGDWIRALHDERIVRERAGFLFKASFDGDHLLLAVVPCLIHGERSYHYDQHLRIEDAFTLLGEVNATGVFTILFKPEKATLSAEDAQRTIETYRRFADFMLAAGYTGEGDLDEVTQDVLATLGLSPAPRTLAGLLE